MPGARQIPKTESPSQESRTNFAGVIAASVEPERFALLRPGEWQIAILGELGERQARGLAAFEDGARDVRGEISQPEHAGKIGAIELLAFGELVVLALARLDQLAVE